MKRKKAKKMLRALRKAKRICEGQERCEGCTFGKTRGSFAECMLDDPPAHWNLEMVKNRLLKTKENTKGNTEGEG